MCSVRSPHGMDKSTHGRHVHQLGGMAHTRVANGFGGVKRQYMDPISNGSPLFSMDTISVSASCVSPRNQLRNVASKRMRPRGLPKRYVLQMTLPFLSSASGFSKENFLHSHLSRVSVARNYMISVTSLKSNDSSMPFPSVPTIVRSANADAGTTGPRGSTHLRFAG